MKRFNRRNQLLTWCNTHGFALKTITSSHDAWFTSFRVPNSPDLCPFDDRFATDFKNRTLLIHKDPTSELARHYRYTLDTKKIYGTLIHELGHIAASKYDPWDHRCREFSFFGWEYAMAMHLRVVPEWCAEHANYVIGEVRDEKAYKEKPQWMLRSVTAFGDLTPDLQKTFLSVVLADAKKSSLVRKDNYPLAVR